MTFPTVVLVDYDPQWPELYEAEKKSILDAIGPHVLEIEHVGSTAIRGMPAKPIIDIMVGTRNVADTADACIGPLRNIGYDYVPKWALLDRRLFRRGAWLLGCMYHLHLAEFGGESWVRHTLFRDELRADPELARRYRELKQRLAVQHEFDRGAYTEAKRPFVNGVLAEVRNRLGR